MKFCFDWDSLYGFNAHAVLLLSLFNLNGIWHICWSISSKKNLSSEDFIENRNSFVLFKRYSFHVKILFILDKNVTQFESSKCHLANDLEKVTVTGPQFIWIVLVRYQIKLHSFNESLLGYFISSSPICVIAFGSITRWCAKIRSTGVDHKSAQIHTITSCFTIGLRCNWFVFNTVFQLCRHYVFWLLKTRSESC